jgi:hypothetical protein
MSTPPRRLSFAVGTSLLTASLSLGAAGCNKKQTVNVHPDEPEETVNEGPVTEPEEPEETVNEGPVAEPEEPHVNEGPAEDPAAEEPEG